MKINEFIKESTTAGAIATVAAPMSTQSRNASIYGGKKGGNLLTGKKTKAKYANSKVSESKMKQVASDLETMQDGNFKQKYGKTKEKMMAILGTPSNLKPKFAHEVNEAHLEEDDLIIVPGQGHRLKSGFIPHDKDRTDHEVEMARSDLFSAAKNAKQVYDLIADVSEEEGLEGWVQEKIIKANDYLNTIREYLEGKQLQSEMTGGVIAGGAGNFEEAAGQKYEMRFKNGKTQRFVAATPEEAKNKAKGLGATSLIKVSRDGMPQGKVLEGIKEKIKGAIRREKAKDLPLIQTRRDYAMTKTGDAYEKGNPRKAAQYSAWAERDRKKKGDPTTNPEGTYRTKTTDYMEGALVDNLFKVRFKNTETGETKDIKVRAPSAKEARSQAESDYTHDSRVWKCLGTKEIANEGAMTTKQPKGEKPWKPSMDRPKGEYDPIYGKAPRKGTVAYNAWKSKRDAALKGDE